MDFKPSIKLTGQTSPSNPADHRLNLKVGQTLNAKVISATTETTKNTLTLKLGDKVITLQSSLPIKLVPGQALQIQVIKTTPVLKFKIVDAALQPKLQTTLLNLPEQPATQTQSSSKIEAQSLALKQQQLEKITELLKQFLPRHQSAAVLLNRLIKDLPHLIQHESLPPTLKDSVIAILQNLPQKQQLLNGLGIKQAINSSGLFLEAKLGQATTSSQTALNEELNIDFKANLLKLARLLQQEVMSVQAVKNHQQAELALLKDLQQKTENTIARIVLDQLFSLPKDDNPKQIWHLELPFVDRDVTETVNLEINQNKDSDPHPDGGNWSVNITLTPPGLGTIHCAICYRDHAINTHFRSQETQTTELIKHNLNYLKTQLEQSGLATGHMNAEDEPQKTQATYLPLAEAKLFDDKA